MIPDLIDIEFWAYGFLFFGSVTGLLAMAVRYYIQNRNEIREKCGEYFTAGQKTWLVWPAVGANTFFEFVFGSTIISVRSLLVTLTISIGANVACVILILTNFPQDFPPIEPAIIRILFYSSLWFISFNFLGDVASLTVTRHCVRKIARREYDLLKYVLLDLSGIILGYFITLLPTVAITLYAIFSSTALNPWIHSGILGNSLIPFFLFIFATKGLPFIFGIWAVISVFSITIPTVIYLSLMGICLVGFKVNEWWLKGKDKSRLELALKFAESFCMRVLVPLVTAVIAVIATYKLVGEF